MPAIDPRHRRRWVAPCDRSLPEADRPYFLWRPLTAGEFSGLAKEDKPSADVLTSLCLGWSGVVDENGQPVAFGVKPISGILTSVEIRAFMDDILADCVFRVDEKKDSGQQLPTDSGNSADSAHTQTG